MTLTNHLSFAAVAYATRVLLMELQPSFVEFGEHSTTRQTNIYVFITSQPPFEPLQ